MVYLHKDKERFREAIDLVVYKTGISSQAVEKDYYVTMILKLLAEEMPFIVFKGGTSLSKCHKVIRRFSEDIDLSVDEYISQGQRKKLKQAIVKVTEMLGLEIENLEDTRSRRVYNKYIVPYQTVLFNENAALQPAVIIETSLAALAFPANVMPVSSFVGDMILEEAPQLIEEYGLDTFEMKVQQINRTLAEKVFAICDYYLRGEVHKYSRHLYDIYKLLPHVPQDEAFRDLVAEVRRIRKGSDYCPSAKDGVDIPKMLGEILSKEIYKSDYINVTEYLLEEKIPYDTVITAIEEIIAGKMFE